MAALNLATLPAGTRLSLVGGRIATIVDNPRDGTWLVCRDDQGEDEELVSAGEIEGIAP